jgi:serpin B
VKFRPIAVWVPLALVAASCGSKQPDRSEGSTTSLTDVSDDGSTQSGADALVLPRRVSATESSVAAGASVAAFGHEVFLASRRLAEPGANVVVSPLSIAVALGMLEPGATGTAIQELLTVLHIDDPAQWRASMSALEQDLETRTPEGAATSDPEHDPGEYTVAVSNAVFLKPGYPLEPDYLEVVATTFGPVIEELDFWPDIEAAADHVNAFVSDGTDGRI